MQFSCHQAGKTRISVPLACFPCEILSDYWLLFLRMRREKNWVAKHRDCKFYLWGWDLSTGRWNVEKKDGISLRSLAVFMLFEGARKAGKPR